MNVADIVSRQAQGAPHKLAVQDRGRPWSYRAFDAAIDRAANGLRDAGVGAGDVVCLRMATGALHLAVAYALGRIGAVLLELSPTDGADLGERLARRFCARMVVTETAAYSIPGLVRIIADPAWLEGRAAYKEAAHPGGDAGWKIVLTSGSTGEPKAVLQTHAMQIAFCECNQAAVPARPDDRYLVILELHFDAGLRHCLFVQWAGGAVVFESFPRTALEVFDTVERMGATYLSLTPMHLHQLVAATSADRPRLPGVRILRSGGMVHTEALCAAVRRRLSPNLFVMYGTNDGGSPLACAAPGAQDRHPGSLGMPCPGVEIQIADESGNALPPGTTGLVRIRSPGTPAAFLDDAEATALKFRGGWYYTGDRGRLAEDGALFFEGRADDMMNFDGIKIFPHEIESVLLAHPAVAAAAAFALHADGHQDVPMAACTLDGQASAAELQRHCKERLGARAPRSVAIMSALPRTPFGKIDKQKLAGMCREKMTGGRR